MSTDKDPDFAGIARKLADQHYVLDNAISQAINGRSIDVAVPALKAKGYASCMEARLRSDWETIRLLKRLPHTFKCGVEWTSAWGIIAEGRVKSGPCTCGLSAHLSKLLEPFTP